MSDSDPKIDRKLADQLERGERPEVNQPLNAERRGGAVPLALTVLLLVVFVAVIAITIWATAHD